MVCCRGCASLQNPSRAGFAPNRDPRLAVRQKRYAMLWWLRFQALARHALASGPTERYFHYDRANGERPLVRGERGEWLPIVVNRERYAAEHSARRLKALASLGHCAAARNGALRQSQDGKMKRSPKSRLGEILSGCLVAVLIGLGTVALTNADAIVASGD